MRAANVKSKPSAKPQPKPRAKPAPKPVIAKATTYKAYIPTHLRNFILLEPQEGNPLKVHSEALFENAILNNYYRLVQNLIKTGILEETTYYFTCRDETRIHRPLGGKYDNGYAYVYPHEDEDIVTHTNQIEDYQASKTAHVALQMAARYGNLKSYIMIEDAVENLTIVLGFNLVDDFAIRSAAILAIGRDEIELFNYVRERTQRSTDAFIYDANSHRCITHFIRTATLRAKKRLARGEPAPILCRRQRWDLFQALIPRSQWYSFVKHAIEYGFTELLNELTDLDQLEDHRDSPVEVILDLMEVRDSDPEALLRSFKWLKELQPKFMDHIPAELLIHYLTPEMLDWCRENQYRINSQALITYLGYVYDFVLMYNYPSVEVANWEACMCKLRSMGIFPDSKKIYGPFGEPERIITTAIVRKYPEYYIIEDDRKEQVTV